MHTNNLSLLKLGPIIGFPTGTIELKTNLNLVINELISDG